MARNLSTGRARRVVVALTLVVVAGCDRFAGERPRSRPGRYADADSIGAALRDVRTVRLRGVISENSAAAMSVRQAGVFFTINDSGNDALLFAIDTTGVIRGTWRVLESTNVDWEAVTLGTCVAPSGDGASRDDCVYIGDTGDNNGSHPNRVIYRTREPDATATAGSLRAQRLVYSYADGPHDVEAMYLTPTGDLMLVTKRPLADGPGRLRPALIFILPASAWNERGAVVARLLDSLPIVPGSAPQRSITDAALAPDARHLAVRTYWQIYVFATDPLTGRIDHSVRASVCDVEPLHEPQGEGITWADSHGRLVLTSEGRNAPLHLVTCPLP